MKNLLVAAYYFPPYANVSTVRSMKFCKYLPGVGWNPLVLTVNPLYYRTAVVKEIPHETKQIRSVLVPYYSIPGIVLFIKLLFPLIICMYSVYQKKNFDAVYISGSPYHPFIATTIISGLFRIPTILDFRDSWSFSYGFDGKSKNTFRGRFKAFFFRVIERISIKFASSVIFATPTLQNEYSSIFPQYMHKFQTITNGFDPDDFNTLTPQRTHNDKTLILTGKFYFYTPEVATEIIKALSSFPDLHFVYIGNEQEDINNIAEREGVGKQVTSLPFQSYRKTIAKVAGADYGLVTSALANILGTKIFDYLALKKPTLCFVPQDSIITEYFRETDTVIICEAPHTQESIQAGLEKLLAVKQVETIDISRFSRKYCTQQLAAVLDRIVFEKNSKIIST